MLTWFIERRLDAFEKSFDYDVSYLRAMLAESPRALLRFQRATALGQHRESVSRDAWFAARLVAIISEDCGPCTQLLVTMAERAGVEPAIIANVVAGEFERLPEPVGTAARFALATLQRSPDTAELRERVVEHWGRRGLISLALSITAARLYPTVKYALGYGDACRRVDVAGKAIVPGARFRTVGAETDPHVSSAPAATLARPPEALL